jgi:hypothetical protein
MEKVHPQEIFQNKDSTEIVEKRDVNNKQEA